MMIDVSAEELSEEIRLEMIALLARAGEVDLGTLYRSLAGLFGAGCSHQIGVALARLVSERAVVIDTRMLGPEGPHVGVVRLVIPTSPPYEALVA